MEFVSDLKEGPKIIDYSAYASLAPAVDSFQTEADQLVPWIKNRNIWMVNATRFGGGVAEMLPRIISIMRQCQLNVNWGVLTSENGDFFKFTKKLHNLIHGQGDPSISEEEKNLYEKVNEENAAILAPKLSEGDIVILHDPQPLAMAYYLKLQCRVQVIWRCHIGLDQVLTQTKAAWRFLQPYFKYIDFNIFSAPEYIPDYLTANVSVIYPGIDPLSHKNRHLSIHKMTGILSNAGLIPNNHPAITKPFVKKAKKLQPNGQFTSPLDPEDIGLYFRPIFTQISRWDRLKGFLPLMQGFAYMKQNYVKDGPNNKHYNTLKYGRLVLGGPDPEYVKDDPEGLEVLNELKDFYLRLPPKIQQDIAIIKIPMHSAKENALIVNALQSSSCLVIQNSLREGFGLTATEAMWKSIPLLGSNACGLRTQIHHRVNGWINEHPEDSKQIAKYLSELSKDPKKVEKAGFMAKKRVIDKFLIFNQVMEWMRVMTNLVKQTPVDVQKV